MVLKLNAIDPGRPPNTKMLTSLLRRLEEASDERDREWCERSLADAMDIEGVEEFGGWVIQVFIRARMAEDRRAEALAWLERHGWSEPKNARRHTRRLGQFLEQLQQRDTYPPADLIRCEVDFGLRRK
jgi:hypothetical protein